jgi:uncharacterized membrane protein YphA (DoxX/SURF4 family)
VLPTLNGRIQTRIFLIVVVGGIWTLIITPLVRLFVEGDPTLSQTYRVTFEILILTLVLGIIWEFIYEGLMQFRWEKDWPTMFGWLTGISEGIVVYYMADYLGATSPEWRAYLSAVTPLPFFIHFASTWIVIQLFATNIMQIIFIRWRFKGGRLIGGW